MNVAIFGAKYNNDLSKFLNDVKSILKKYNVTKIDDHYFDTTRDEDYHNSAEAFRSIENSLYKADVVIIEATRNSGGIGIITGIALGLKKPVLMLYSKETHGDTISSVAKASERSKRSFAESYDDSNLDEIIKRFINNAETMIDAKFFINLSSEINRYLEWCANYYRIPKVEKIRDLIREDMKNNGDWRKLLAGE